MLQYEYNLKIYNSHGILILVGICPYSINSLGSRTSTRSFSGWFGKSFTSSYEAIWAGVNFVEKVFDKQNPGFDVAVIWKWELKSQELWFLNEITITHCVNLKVQLNEF